MRRHDNANRRHPRPANTHAVPWLSHPPRSRLPDTPASFSSLAALISNLNRRHQAPATTQGGPWLHQQPRSRHLDTKTALPSPSVAATIIPWLASRTQHPSTLWTLDTRNTHARPPTTPAKAVSQHSTEDLQHLVCFYQKASRAESTWVNIDGTARRYTEFTDERYLPAFPVTAIPLAMFMVNYCHVQGHTSRSLSGIQSCLKTYSTQNGHAWLTPEHERIIREVRKGLANHDHSVPLRKLPITSAIINKLRTRTMDLRRPDDHQLLVMCLVAHNGLLRGTELCLINRQDVHRTASGFSVYIHKSKSNKQGHREEVVYPHFDGTAASVIDLHLSRTQHLNHKALFVNFETQRRMTKAIFSTAIRAKLHQAGYPSGSYSAHSFRSGGATDLFHNNCPPLYIKMHGRWKSDTFQIYIRDNPEARAAQLATAFAAC